MARRVIRRIRSIRLESGGTLLCCIRPEPSGSQFIAFVCVFLHADSRGGIASELIAALSLATGWTWPSFTLFSLFLFYTYPAFITFKVDTYVKRTLFKNPDLGTAQRVAL